MKLARFLIFFLVLPLSVFSQEEPEAPLSLWNWTLADQEVELTVQGTWDIQLGAGTGFSVLPVGLGAPIPYPGLTLGWIFTQAPKLSLALWLEKTYFFRVNYHGSLETSTFLLGYENKSGLGLRWFKVGTEPFSTPSYAQWDLGTSNPGNMQIGLGWDGESSRHDLLLRLETSSRLSKNYLGDRELVTHRWNLSDWAREKIFQLPQKNISGLTILVQDQGGIRALQPGEFSWNLEEGVLRPLNWAGTRIYITYDGMDTSGITPPVTSVTLPAWGGKTFMVIDRQSLFLPLEGKNIYGALEALPLGETKAKVVFKGTTTPVPGQWIFTWTPENNQLRVTDSSGGIEPFSALVPGLYSEIPLQDQEIKYEILLEILGEKPGFQLGTDIKAGSVDVRRNGQKVYDYTLDPGTGTLTFFSPIFPGDETTVTFETNTQGESLLMGAQGNRFNFSDHHWLDTAFWLRWNWDQTTYSTLPGERPGKGTLRIQHVYNDSFFQSRGTISGNGGVNDATGLLRWLPLDGEGFTSALAQRLIRPSSIPLVDAFSTFDMTNYLLPQKNNRGILKYRDLTYRDGSGYEGLRKFSTEIPTQPYEKGSFTGPYVAGGYEGNQSGLGVMDFKLQGGQWVAFQNYFEEGRIRDISGVTKITLNQRLITSDQTGASGLRYFLQIGEQGEDWDGSGKIEPLTGDGQGLPFNDGNLDLRIPQTGVQSFTKDWEKKGYLREETENQLIWDLPQPPQNWDTPWEFELTTSQRALLARTNAYRIIIMAPVASLPTEGVYLVESPKFEGTSFSFENVSLHEGKIVQETWRDRDPELFGKIGGIAQKVLETRWTGSPGWAGTWHAAVPSGDYRYFGFFVKNPSASDLQAQVFLGDSQENGWTLPINIPGNSPWEYYELKLSSGEILVNGTVVGLAAKTGTVDQFTDLKLNLLSGALGGSLLWDEFHFRESLVHYGIQGSWEGSLDYTLWDSLKVKDSWSAAVASDKSGFFNPRQTLGLGPWTVITEGSFRRSSEGDIQTQAGYELDWKTPYLSLIHRFSDGGQKYEEASLVSPFKLSGIMDTQFSATDTKQSFRGSWESTFGGLLTTGVNTEFRQTTLPPEFWTSSFFEQWNGSWHYSWFDPSAASKRTAQGQLKILLPLKPWTFSLLNASSQGTEALNSTFQNNLTAGLDWKEEVTDRPAWLGGLFWNRLWKTDQSPKVIETWGPFSENWLHNWQESWKILGRPPGWDWLANSQDLLKTATKEELKNTITFSLSRPRLLSLTDLFPGKVELNLSRVLHWEGQGFETWEMNSQISSQALNIFGTKGFFPLFPWYDTDQWSYNFQWKANQITGGGVIQSFSLTPNIILYEKNGAWGSQSGLNWGEEPWNWKTTLWREWKLPPPRGWKFPYMPTPREFEPELIQKLALSLSGEEVRWLSLALAEYMGTWNFSPNGSLVGTLRWGQIWVFQGYSTQIEAGLHIKITF